jgi:hypothetical protein
MVRRKKQMESRVIKGRRKTYGGSNISLQLLCKKATPACELSALLFFLDLKELPSLWLEMLIAKLLTTKKVTAVTTERLSGEARLVYIWLMAPGWFERLVGAIVCVCDLCAGCVEKRS